MKLIAMFAASMALVMLMVAEGEAECCYARFKLKLGEDNDLTKPEFYVTGCGDCTDPTPYCGYGKCNIFGCNCDGGCRRGRCSGAPTKYAQTPVQSDAEFALLEADTDGDGRVSIDEAVVYLTANGRAVTRDDVRAFDKNGDGFISANEIDG